MPASLDILKNFKNYRWSKNHPKHGYPPDSFPKFEWIHSLERRFDRTFRQREIGQAPLALLEEMILWGGNQNGVHGRFTQGLANIALKEQLQLVKESIAIPDKALRAALKIPGMDLTYASKVLRFIDPNHYGALDSKVRKALAKHYPGEGIPAKLGGKAAKVNAYMSFLRFAEKLRLELYESKSYPPPCDLYDRKRKRWRIADIEMAIFSWALEEDNRSKRRQATR